MSCNSLVFTQLGNDTLTGAAGPLNPSNWVTPIETGHAITLTGTSASGNGGLGGEAEWVGSVAPSDQYVAVTWMGVLAAEYIDLTVRRDPTNVSALFEASFTHGSTSAFLLDNAGVWQSNFNLSSPLATGDKLRFSVLGTQACVWRDTGSGYVLEHTDTLPAVLPTGGTVAGQSGFNLSGAGLANAFQTGSVAASSVPTLTATLADGSPLPAGVAGIRFQTINIGAHPNYAFPTESLVPGTVASYKQGSYGINITGTSGAWTISADSSWITFSKSSGTGDQLITCSLNTGPAVDGVPHSAGVYSSTITLVNGGNTVTLTAKANIGRSLTDAITFLAS